MSAGMLWLNGQDAETTFGLIVVSFAGGSAGSGRRQSARAAGGVLGGLARTYALLDIPGSPGSIDPGLPLSEDVRGVIITALVQATDQTTLYATLDAIKEVCGTGLVEIRTAYSPARAFYGILETPDVQAYTPTLLNGWATVMLAFTCPNPYAIALTHATIGFGATPVDIPLGTAPSTGRDGWSAIIEIVGAAVAPTLTYYNASSDVVGTMAFTNTVAAGDSQIVDVGRRKVWRVTAGVWTNGMGDLTAGYAWPALSIVDGSYAGSMWPKLSVSTGTASIRYFKHYR